MLRPLFLLAVLVVSPSLFAKGYSPAVTARAGGYDVKFSANGTPLAVPVAGGLAPSVTAPFVFQWPNGVDAAGAAISIFTGAKTAGAWGAASAVVGIASLYAIPPIKNWMDTAALAPMNGGGVGVRPAGADNYDYSTDGGNNYSSTALLACYAQDARVNSPSSGPWYKRTTKSYRYTSGSAGFCAGDIVLQNHSDTTTNYYGVDLYGTDRRDKIIPVQPEPITISAAELRLSQSAPTAAIVQALVDLNFPPQPETATLSGTPSLFKGNTVQLGLDGTVTEIEERYIASFQPGIIGIGVEKKQTVTTPAKTSSTITTNPDGSTTTAVTTTPQTSSTLTTTAPSSEPASVTCGLPGTPACKLDETGTPAPVATAEYPDKLTKLETDSAASIPKIAATDDKSFFEPLRSLFVVPPIATCQPFALPRNMGSIDPCPVADGMRLVMGYIWALGGLFLSLRMVREVI